MFLYSPTTNSFYLRECLSDYKELPADLIKISYEDWSIFNDVPPKGMTRGFVDGELSWIESGDPSMNEVCSIERAWRDQELKWADIEINKRLDDDENYTLFSNYRKNLRDWPENEYFPNINYRPLRPGI